MHRALLTRHAHTPQIVLTLVVILGFVEVTTVRGMLTSMRCKAKMLRMVLRIGSTCELSVLVSKKSGAKVAVTSSSLYLLRPSSWSSVNLPPLPTSFQSVRMVESVGLKRCMAFDRGMRLWIRIAVLTRVQHGDWCRDVRPQTKEFETERRGWF